MALVRVFDLAGEAVLEATACAIQAEAKGAEGAAQCSTRLPLFGVWLVLGAVTGLSLFTNIRRVDTAANFATLNVQEVTTSAKRTNTKGAKGATWDVPAAALGRTLFSGTVHEQASTAIVTVATCVIAAAQLRLVLWVAEGNMELMEAMGKLTALCILAEASGRVAGAELRLVPGGTDPWNEGWGGGLYQGKQCFGQ